MDEIVHKKKKKKRTKQKFKACFQQDMAHEGFKELTSF